LFNFDPPATDEEIHAAAVQFVRKISGSTRPAKTDHAALDQAVVAISARARTLLDSLTATAPPRDRAVEAAKAKARSAQRFSRAS